MKKLYLAILLDILTTLTPLVAEAQSPPFNATSISTLGGSCASAQSIPYQASGAITQCLGLGASGQQLIVSGSNIAWGTAAASGTIASGTANALGYYAAAGTTISPIAAGTNGYVLTMAAGVPTWAVSTAGAINGTSGYWTVDASGNLDPVTTNANSLGTNAARVSTVFATNVDATSIFSESSGPLSVYGGPGRNLFLGANGTAAWYIGGGGSGIGTIFPNTDNTYSLGSSDQRVASGYFVNLGASGTPITTAYISSLGTAANPISNAYVTNLTMTSNPGSGSAQATTATCTASSANVTLASALDFVNGQGISVEHCGTTFTGASPTGVSASASGDVGQGPTGTTNYNYSVACVDENGGVGAAVAAAAITNGYATLGVVTQSSVEVAYNHVYYTTSCPAVAIWRNIASAGYHLIAVTANTTFYDSGAPQISVPWLPDAPPASALPDRLVSTVLSGGGTTALVLANVATNAGSGVYTRHDDTSALTAYLGANTGARLPTGTFNVEAVTIPTSVTSIVGAGRDATIVNGWNATESVFSSTTANSITISGLSVNEQTSAGYTIFLNGSKNCSLDHLSVSGGTPINITNTSQCSLDENKITSWYNQGIFVLSSSYASITNNVLSAGNSPAAPGAIGIYMNGANNGLITKNMLSGGTYFGIELTTSGNNIASNNIIMASQREAIHISGSGNANLISANYINGSTASIDYGISTSDDGLASVVQNSNSIVQNEIINSGTSAIAVVQWTGTSPSINTTNVIGNIITNSNRCAVAGTPDILLGGSAVTSSFVNGNTAASGAPNVNYAIQEQNYSGRGFPANSQIGANYGNAGASGFASVSGSGSIILSGGSTGK